MTRSVPILPNVAPTIAASLAWDLQASMIEMVGYSVESWMERLCLCLNRIFPLIRYFQNKRLDLFLFRSSIDTGKHWDTAWKKQSRYSQLEGRPFAGNYRQPIDGPLPCRRASFFGPTLPGVETELVVCSSRLEQTSCLTQSWTQEWTLVSIPSCRCQRQWVSGILVTFGGVQNYGYLSNNMYKRTIAIRKIFAS